MMQLPSSVVAFALKLYASGLMQPGMMYLHTALASCVDVKRGLPCPSVADTVASDA